MKKLLLIRHAKSSWLDHTLTDFERPLNDRGRMYAPMMGELLARQGAKPDIIYSSPANRALATARIIAEKLNYPLDDIIVKEKIYEGHHHDLMQLINALDDKYEYAVFFGHNPAFTFLAEQLTHQEIGNIPTCGVYGISFKWDKWSKIREGDGENFLFLYPKKDLKGEVLK